jgi:hypothetical protein
MLGLAPALGRFFSAEEDSVRDRPWTDSLLRK